MAIEMVDSGPDAYQPRFFCDSCGGRITDPQNALVTWPTSAERTTEYPPRVAEFFILHRRDCDSEIRDSRRATAWMGIDEWVDSLAKSLIR